MGTETYRLLTMIEIMKTALKTAVIMMRESTKTMPKAIDAKEELDKRLIGNYLKFEKLNELSRSKRIKINHEENISYNENNELKLMMQIYLKINFISNWKPTYNFIY